MTIATIISLAVTASIFLTVLGFALRETLDDTLYLLKRPALLARAVLSISVIMPLFVGLMVWIFPLDRNIEIALVAIATSPIPPILPNKAFKQGGRRSYTIGLLTIVSLLAIITVPLGLAIFEWAFNRTSRYDSTGVAGTIAIGVLIPLFLGIVIRRFAPAFAERAAGPTTKVGLIVLLLAFLPFIFVSLPIIWTLIGNGTLLAIAAFVIVGLTVGHLLGGPDPNDRTVLALATASRHPGIAIAIASANTADPKLGTAGVILFLLVSAIVAGPYMKWLASDRADKPEAAL